MILGNIRCSDEVMEKFKEVTSELGVESQGIALQKLIDVYNFQCEKISLGNRKSEIDKFEGYVSLITDMFMVNIQQAEHMEETVRSDFASRLNSKEQIIIDLQGKIAEYQQLIKSTGEEQSELSKLNKEYDKTIQNFAQLNAALMESNESYKDKLATMEKQLQDEQIKSQSYHTLTEECNTLKVTNNTLENEITELSLQLRDSKSKYDSMQEQDAIKLEKALITQSKEYEQRITDLQNKHDTEIKNLKKQYNALDTDSKKEIRELQHELQHLHDEKQKEIDMYQDKYLHMVERLQDAQNIKNI